MDHEPTVGLHHVYPDQFTLDGVVYAGGSAALEGFEKIKSGDVVDYDLLIATYPRSGGSRLLEACWLLLNDINISKAREVDVFQRHVFLEMFHLSPTELASPRIAKTHVKLDMAKDVLTRKGKIIVGLRNPKDALVSFYHFHRMNSLLGLFPGNWHQFMEKYMKHEVAYGDFFDYVLSWWKLKDHKDVLFVEYEEMSERPVEILRQIADFLGKPYSNEQLQVIGDWISFSNMSSNKSTNYTSIKALHQDISPYLRQGITGDWKNYFNREESNYIDKQCRERCDPVELHFKFE